MIDRKQCEIVQDLIPLYKDGALSAETTDFVRRHLEICADCRSSYFEQKKERQNAEVQKESLVIEGLSREEALKADDDEERERYQKIARRIKWRRRRGWIVAAAMIVFVWILAAGLLQRAVVSGNCMEPAVADGEEYMLNKWSYRLSGPKRNDIIVYEEDGVYYITRIIGLPGETIEMKKGVIYIDDSPLTDREEYPASCDYPVRELGKEEYWTVVDNLAAPENGCRIVVQKNIVGKAWITH